MDKEQALFLGGPLHGEVHAIHVGQSTVSAWPKAEAKLARDFIPSECLTRRAPRPIVYKRNWWCPETRRPSVLIYTVIGMCDSEICELMTGEFNNA